MMVSIEIAYYFLILDEHFIIECKFCWFSFYMTPCLILYKINPIINRRTRIIRLRLTCFSYIWLTTAGAHINAPLVQRRGRLRYLLRRRTLLKWVFAAGTFWFLAPWQIPGASRNRNCGAAWRSFIVKSDLLELVVVKMAPFVCPMRSSVRPFMSLVRAIMSFFSPFMNNSVSMRVLSPSLFPSTLNFRRAGLRSHVFDNSTSVWIARFRPFRQKRIVEHVISIMLTIFHHWRVLNVLIMMWNNYRLHIVAINSNITRTRVFVPGPRVSSFYTCRLSFPKSPRTCGTIVIWIRRRILSMFLR